MRRKQKNHDLEEIKRLEQIKFMMEHWDELPERMQGKFEGTLSAVSDLINRKTG